MPSFKTTNHKAFISTQSTSSETATSLLCNFVFCAQTTLFLKIFDDFSFLQELSFLLKSSSGDGNWEESS